MMKQGTHPYYANKLATLKDIFGIADVAVGVDSIRVGESVYPIVDDVIVLLPAERRPARLQQGPPLMSAEFARDVQHSFGAEWTSFPEILPDHEEIFRSYFDQVNLSLLRSKRVADFGCGMGRWSSFVAPQCREIVLVDFSDAIFVARKNLRSHPNALFFMADVTALPFRDDAFDFAFSLGVLHHIPMPALDTARRLSRLAPEFLVYLYYALDNRPRYFRLLLRGVSAMRRRLSRIQNERARLAWSSAIALFVYRPLVGIGWLAYPFGRAQHVPLWEGYRRKKFHIIRQDAYDRFFTRIEQRVSHAEIVDLREKGLDVEVAPTAPYWHFLLRRRPG